MIHDINDVKVVEAIDLLTEYRMKRDALDGQPDADTTELDEAWTKFWYTACECVEDLPDCRIPGIISSCKETHLYYDNIVAALTALGFTEDDDE